MLVFADDLVLMAENAEDLTIMIECFYSLSEERGKS